MTKSRVVMAWMPTSAQTRCNRRAGFTLIEVLIVVALIALAAVFAVPRVTSVFKVSIQSSARKLATVIKDTYNAAALSGRVHRLVFDLKKGEYWVEAAPEGALLLSERSEKLAATRKSVFDRETPEESVFRPAPHVMRGKTTLPRGVSFKDIVTERSVDPIREGVAYIHFFPNGISEQTLIHLTDLEEHQSSLIVSPVVGKTRWVQNYVEAREVFGK